MGIFSSIRNAIFGDDDAPAAPARPAAPAAPATPATTPGAAAAAAPATPKPQVDVDAVLSAKAAAKGGDLNYRSSIVDLMKALDMDPSYANRKELAEELGIAGYEGSAEQNIALHKAVLKELAANGGKVPAELID